MILTKASFFFYLTKFFKVKSDKGELKKQCPPVKICVYGKIRYMNPENPSKPSWPERLRRLGDMATIGLMAGAYIAAMVYAPAVPIAGAVLTGGSLDIAASQTFGKEVTSKLTGKENS